MRARSWLLLALAGAGCTRAAPVELAGSDAAAVVVALLDEDGAVRAVELSAPDAARPFAIRLGAPYPVVTFPLFAEDFVHASGEPVSGAELRALSVRTLAEAAPADRGACGRCVEPPDGALQVVRPGDSCAPSPTRARIFAGEASGLRDVPRDDWAFDEAEVVRRVAGALRLDWPGACGAPLRPVRVRAAPRFTPISPGEDPWPVWAFAQSDAGVLGLFGEGRQAVWQPDGTTFVADREPLSGRPRAAAALPDFAEGTQRFLLATDLAREGDAQGSAYRIFEVRDGLLRSSPARLDGVPGDEAIEVWFARWFDTDSGARLVLGGSRNGRPEVVTCTPDGAGLECEGVPFEGAACANVGPIRDLVATPRGWFGVAERAFVQAVVGPRGPQRWWCHDPGTQEIEVRVEAPDEVTPRLRSVAHLEGRLFACAEPIGFEAHAYVLTAQLPADGPFVGQRIPFEQRRTYDSARCGEFSVPVDQLGAAPPDRVRLDVMAHLLDLFPDGRDAIVDQGEYRRLTGLPQTRILQRAPGWLIQLSGWAVEPRALGAGVLVRDATREFELVAGRSSASDLIEVVARADDFVAFNAFTDGAPYRIEVGPSVALEEVEQAPESQLQVDRREGVEAALFDAASGEVLLVGNTHEAEDGSIVDFDARRWKPFLRRLSPDLTLARDVALPLDRGQFLCGAATLDDGEYLLVGGQGALLRYDGARFEQVPIDYDDPYTEAVEQSPIALNTGRAEPNFLSVDVQDGVAWVGGGLGLVVRVARERVDGEITWVARRVSIERAGTAGLRTPLTGVTHFTHVTALSPDRAVFAAQARPRFINSGCPRMRRERRPGDRGDLVEIAPSEDPAAPFPLVWRSWPVAPEQDTLSELVSGGIVATGDTVFTVQWNGFARGFDGATERLPFYPVAATRGPAGHTVIVGANLRVAVAAPTP